LRGNQNRKTPELLQARDEGYKSAYPYFPQETTLDQFFDEAQWESHRKLGRQIAEQIAPGLPDCCQIRRSQRQNNSKATFQNRAKPPGYSAPHEVGAKLCHDLGNTFRKAR
jgi:hypothetical protein